MATKVIKHSNTVVLSGSVVADAQTRQGGNIVAFRLAHNNGRDRESLFIDVTAFVKGFQKRNQVLPTDILVKGAKVLVEGFLTPNNWTDANGVKHHNIVVIATSITDNTAADDQIPDGGVELDEDIPANVDPEQGV